jgi:citrate synthase
MRLPAKWAEIFTVLFAIPRTAGWLAQWQELITDPEQKIARPRQVYTGQAARDVAPIENRVVVATDPTA